MNVTMVHPVHGAKVAISDIEMRSDIENGWTPLEDDSDRGVEAPPIAEKIPDFLTPEPKPKGRRRAT